jgi:catechol 2,3-dioxygenase-like lactoylglutathione lyase family enzyme
MAHRILDHSSVRIRDLARSRPFYEGLLGLEPAPRPDLGVPGTWYALGRAQLHLIQNEGIMPGSIDPTNPHFAIEVDDLDAMRRQLKAAGVEMLELGGEQLWILDPDGNTVELRAPAAAPK